MLTDLKAKEIALSLGPVCSGLLVCLASPAGLLVALGLALLPVLRPRPAAAGNRPIRPIFVPVAFFRPSLRRERPWTVSLCILWCPRPAMQLPRATRQRYRREPQARSWTRGWGGVGGDVVFSAGTPRVPFTPTRAAWKNLRVSHGSGSSYVRHPDLLTSTSSSSTMPWGSLTSSQLNLKPPQNSQMLHAPRSSQVQEWEVSLARAGGPGRKVYARGSKRNVCAVESSEEGVRGAIQVYERANSSSSSKASHLSHLKWWVERCKVRRCAPYPLIVPKLQ